MDAPDAPGLRARQLSFTANGRLVRAARRGSPPRRRRRAAPSSTSTAPRASSSRPPPVPPPPTVHQPPPRACCSTADGPGRGRAGSTASRTRDERSRARGRCLLRYPVWDRHVPQQYRGAKNSPPSSQRCTSVPAASTLGPVSRFLGRETRERPAIWAVILGPSQFAR